MPAFDVKYSYIVEEFGETIINADDTEQAEMFTREFVMETWPEASSVVIDSVKEV